jgi:hypothetical protein
MLVPIYPYIATHSHVCAANAAHYMLAKALRSLTEILKEPD